VTIQKDTQTVDASSIHALMSLAAMQGTELVLTATGPEAAHVVDALAYLFATEFGISYQDVGS
jgi:phosphotransferase system HPr (HPr) family protein